MVTPKGAIGSSDPVVFLPPKFFNDLDLVEIPGSASWSEEGSLQKEIPDGLLIYFTDTSYKHARGQNRQEILDGAPRGRFFSYDTRNSELKVILCGLHFPNGVQVLNKNEILLVESTRFRILKVNVKNAEVPNTLLNSCAEDGSLASYLKGDKDSLPIVSVFLDAVPGFMDNIRPDSLQHVNADSARPAPCIAHCATGRGSLRCTCRELAASAGY